MGKTLLMSEAYGAKISRHRVNKPFRRVVVFEAAVSEASRSGGVLELLMVLG
jgi:hypothetical protein